MYLGTPKACTLPVLAAERGRVDGRGREGGKVLNHPLGLTGQDNKGRKRVPPIVLPARGYPGRSSSALEPQGANRGELGQLRLHSHRSVRVDERLLAAATSLAVSHGLV
jgi:hypothetical protein